MKFRLSLLAAFFATTIFVGAGCSATKDMVKNHLEFVRAGDLDQAYTDVAKSAQSTLTPAVFKNLIATTAPLAHYSDSTFNEVSVSNNIGTVKGSITGTDGSAASIEYQLIDEGGLWKMTNILVNGQQPAQVAESLNIVERKIVTDPEDAMTTEGEVLHISRASIKKIGIVMKLSKPVEVGDIIQLDLVLDSQVKPVFSTDIIIDENLAGEEAIRYTVNKMEDEPVGAYHFVTSVKGLPTATTGFILE